MLRNVVPSDAGRISEIYAYYVENTSITFETMVPTQAEMADRIAEYTKKYPWIVCEIGGRVVGYAYASAFRKRAAYDPTAELSIYMDKDYCSRGYGKILLEELFARLRAAGYYTAIAVITVPNEKSERLVKKAGFSYVGTLENVGRKRGIWHSTMLYSCPLKAYD